MSKFWLFAINNSWLYKSFVVVVNVTSLFSRVLKSVFALVFKISIVKLLSLSSITAYPISSTELVRVAKSSEALSTKVAEVEVFSESTTFILVAPAVTTKSGLRVAVPAVDGSLITPLTIPSLSPYPPSINSRWTASAIPSPLVS